MFTKDEKAIIWLDIFDNLTIKRKYELLNMYASPKELFANFKNDFNKVKSILEADEFNKMAYALDENFIDKQIFEYEKIKVSLVTLFSKEYPNLLKETATPPLVLYCRGDLSLLNSECLAVVGTRRATRYGKKVTESFVKELALNGFTIVSGLADGIDTIAHRTALENGGKTIAVLGGGVDQIYPYANVGLSREVVAKGLLISEYKPDQKPAGFHFPVRNRIIAGISKGVLITEAGEKSGSMHTKEYAIEAGRDLFVVPGNIDSTASAGCNQIIKSLQGAMVTSADDILENYGKTNSYKGVLSRPSLQLTMDEQIIINIIGNEECHYDELLEKTNFDTKTLNSLLTTMQVRGIIKKLPGNLYEV
ncbi:MAG: DNA-processing protein DprA [Spirochaetales bacterium]